MTPTRRIRGIRIGLTWAWALTPFLALALSIMDSKSIALLAFGFVDGLGSAWAMFFAAGIIGKQLEQASGPNSNAILGRWTFEHVPALCWPLVRGAYSSAPDGPLAGVSHEALLLFRTSHIVFFGTILVLLIAVNLSGLRTNRLVPRPTVR
jgi:hypothetical protein